MNAKIAITILAIAAAIILLFILGPKQSFDVSWLLPSGARQTDSGRPDTDIHDAVDFVRVK